MKVRHEVEARLNEIRDEIEGIKVSLVSARQFPPGTKDDVIARWEGNIRYLEVEADALRWALL